MNLLNYQINGDYIDIQAATSIKQDKTLRYREESGRGGIPNDSVRGSNRHRKKMLELANKLSQITGNNWDIKDLVFIDQPRQYYGVISDGNLEFAYQYISTYAPGSGQQYFFSPFVSSTRILNARFDMELAAWMMHCQLEMDYQNINWDDRKIILDLIRQGVTADVMRSTVIMMR